jgi:hypothetical protein
MSKQNIINEYNSKIVSLNKQIASIEELKLPLQASIDELKSPTAQVDEQIAQLTVDLNNQIYNLSIISNAAFACGCGTTAVVIVPVAPPGTGTTSVTVVAGNTYYYENAKAHRINAENLNYYGTAPNKPLEGTDGSTSFNSGYANNTVIVGSSSNSILELIVNNPGSGFISSTYYSQPLVGGTGNSAKADITISPTGNVTDIIVNNGGTGYSVNDVLTVAAFPGASFTVTDIGSPILGIGIDTYIVASSGIGSVFIPTILSSGISRCTTSCVDYNSQVNVVLSNIAAIRTYRDTLLSGVNSMKVEMTKLYKQRYGYIFGEGTINDRKTQINNIINVLNNSTYNQYFS